MKCALCELEFTEPKKFHMHLARKHKTRMEVYYREHYPRNDLLTGEGIKFKSYDFYFSSLFNSRENMIKYLREQTPCNAQAMLPLILKARKKMKGMTLAPSTVETRTSILPSPALVFHMGHDWSELCQSVGLAIRYNYKQKLLFDDDKGFDVLVDTREQRPLDFDCPKYVSKLDFGDYTTHSHYKKVFVERKSLPDLWSTMSQGFDRVQREFDRSVEFGASVIVCVEEPIKNLMVGPKRNKSMKATPEFITHRIREICQKYPNVQFLFLNSRDEMVPIVKKIFLLKNPIDNVDLQYYYDTKKLSV